MKLSESIIGVSYKIEKIDLPQAMAKRLEALGMTGNTTLKVMNNKSHGVLIIKVRGTRFALGRNITEQIEVSPE